MTQDTTPGAFTRRIVCIADGDHVFTALEDDFHHFYARIGHDGKAIRTVAGRALRVPRSSCPNAMDGLQRFVGLALDARSTGIDASWQCTHAYELVRLAMAQALRRAAGGSAQREYLIRVPDRIERRTRAVVERDGQFLFAWDIEGRNIIAPERFAGVDIFGSSRWPADLDADQLEAAQVLRRGAWLAVARVNYVIPPAGVAPVQKQRKPGPASGACYSYQPAVEAQASSMDGLNWRDFTQQPDALLAELGHPSSVKAMESSSGMTDVSARPNLANSNRPRR